ncbi:hypothetical protein [Nocardioides mesophilus]|uniref:Uncharacterized protein n=1 Tax=Nocardioides mesophilus TaxID=433659 RepID=A0A7G9RDZ9_9ACTN|nr:hypothetical protein [Nocardioides mesophilus]QNN53824.1 hypothetical protein H9L09_05310 [Nocardioides mesophilus]
MKALVTVVALLGALAAVTAGVLPALSVTLDGRADVTSARAAVAAGPAPAARGREKHEKKNRPEPGWMRHQHGPASHGRLMRAWAHCVAEHASARRDGGDDGRGDAGGSEDRFDPESACGTRPVPPGRQHRPGDTGEQPDRDGDER